ncbi:MAG: protein translocase subunit SecD [Alphaproteobacteria bacterium]|nr:MAG: protein translocase subunit SecD [Alphaproteobacteria bacterium]
MVHFTRWQITVIVTVCLLGVIYALPNMLPSPTRHWLETHLPAWMPVNAVNLGLDLQGGSHLLLQVEADKAIEERLEGLVDEARNKLRSKNLGYSDLGMQDGALRVVPATGTSAAEIADVLRQIDRDMVLSTEGGTVTLKPNEVYTNNLRRQILDQAIGIVGKRIDATGTREPSIQRQGSDRIVVQLPGVSDPDRIKRLLGQTAKLTFHMVNESADPAAARAGRAPQGFMVVHSAENPEQVLVVGRRPLLGGGNLLDAQVSFQDSSLSVSEPVVTFRFDSDGARKFADATTKNVGRPFAIVMDNKVISAPVIREPILGGSGIISGHFTSQSASDLALLLRAGALPAPLTVLEERTVGPGLGADSIRAGAFSALAGAAAIVVLILVIYGMFGLFACLALVFNIALLFAALSVLGSTLTLPGIAGIVLTIGTAVDANVLIFERIREELRLGRSPISAVDTGFRNALSAIVDANMTTLIAAGILFGFGGGPIKGFAVTLSLGTIISMFTAITVTRLMVVTWMRRARPKTLRI